MMQKRARWCFLYSLAGFATSPLSYAEASLCRREAREKENAKRADTPSRSLWKERGTSLLSEILAQARLVWFEPN